MTIILASGSPRRRDLLTWAGVAIEVRPQDIDESWDPSIPPIEHAQRLATDKARSALSATAEVRPVIAADTVVHMAGQIYDKPLDRDQAREHLRALSGQQHQVTTGVCIAAPDRPQQVFCVTTALRFRSLTLREIEAYLRTGEADDKAGAYAIQGIGGAFVAEVHGSWTNVMGLPLEQTLHVLEAFLP